MMRFYSINLSEVNGKGSLARISIKILRKHLTQLSAHREIFFMCYHVSHEYFTKAAEVFTFFSSNSSHDIDYYSSFDLRVYIFKILFKSYIQMKHDAPSNI